MISNVQRLTRGDRKYAAKKAQQTPEVKFDFDSRQEYLTGFHKRKLQRQAEARKKAEEIARQERILERQKLREERKQLINDGLEKLEQAEEIIHENDEFKGFENKGILKRTIGQSEVSFEEINMDPFVDVSRSEKVLEEATLKAKNYAKHVAQVEARERRKKFRYKKPRRL